MGNLRVHSLANGNLQMETFLEAHDAEILALDFGGEQGNLLASAGMAGCVSVSVSVSLSVSVSVSVSAFCMALDVWAT
jgi:hypothetical protein